MKGLLKRLATAIFFVLVMLGGLYAGRYSFVLLFGIITALCLWEFYRLVLSRRNRADLGRLFIGLALGLSPSVATTIVQLQLVQEVESFIILSALLFFPFVFMAFIYELYTRSTQPFTNIAFLMLGVVYIGIPFALLDFIAFDGDYFYANTVFGLLLLTWTNDTAAYVVGSRIGKHPLFPRISPKKTWEGSVGGWLITLLVAWLLSLFIDDLSALHWLGLGLIVAVFGSFGDLVESMLKRSVAIKDSGHLLPGHGGMLDRFDAFIFLLPYATAYLLWIR